MGGDRVTWRLEILRGWGERLDPSWLPAEHTESWRRIFAAEDLAARFCAAGGGGLAWGELARAVSTLAEVLAQYRLQWRVAEQVAADCPVDAAAHLAAMAVPVGLRPPRLTLPRGRWRLCVAAPGGPARAGEFGSADLAEGAAVAARCGTALTCWAEPVAASRDRAPAPDDAGVWRPRVDTDLRLVAFAAEQSVVDLVRAAATGHTGPDVLELALLCRLGLAAHQFVKEYRTLFRAAWDHLEACPQAEAHDADAQAALDATGDERAATGPWRHVRLVQGEVRTESRHDDLAAAAASVAARRAVDDRRVRWAEPVLADPG